METALPSGNEVREAFAVSFDHAQGATINGTWRYWPTDPVIWQQQAPGAYTCMLRAVAGYEAEAEVTILEAGAPILLVRVRSDHAIVVPQSTRLVYDSGEKAVTVTVPSQLLAQVTAALDAATWADGVPAAPTRVDQLVVSPAVYERGEPAQPWSPAEEATDAGEVSESHDHESEPESGGLPTPA